MKKSEGRGSGWTGVKVGETQKPFMTPVSNPKIKPVTVPTGLKLTSHDVSVFLLDATLAFFKFL